MRFIAVLAFFLLMCNLTKAQSPSVADSCLKRLNVEKEKNDSLVLLLLDAISFNITNIDSSMHYAEELISFASAKKNIKSISRGYYLKSIGYYRKAKFQDALDCLIKAAGYANEINSQSLLSIINVQMGSVYISMNNNSLAIESFRKAIETLRKINKPNNLAAAYVNLAAAYQLTDNVDSAYHYYFLADSIYVCKGNKISSAYAKGNIGIILAKKQSFDSAWVYLETSHQILLQKGHYQAAIAYQLWLSIIEQNRGHLNSALNYATESLQIAEKHGLKEQIRDSHKQMASIYSSMCQYQKANDALVQFYAYRDSIVNTETITQMANMRTEFEVGQKQAELDAVKKSEVFKSRINWLLLIAFTIVATLFVVVYRNFKSSRRLSRQLKAQKDELELVNTAKDRLFSVLAHDLRSPIGAIGNLVYLANDAFASNDKDGMSHVLDLIDTSHKQVEELLDKLLHWTVTQRGAFKKTVEEFDFNQLINGVLSIYQPIANAKEIVIEYNNSNHINCVKTDANSWAVIIRNLLNNAIKFTHHGGIIKVELAKNNNNLQLTITDNGIGIEPTLLKTLFIAPKAEATWGTNREKGIGLGLSLVKEFIELNDGTIKVESQPGQGSTFTISMPVIFVDTQNEAHNTSHFPCKEVDKSML